MSIGYSRAKWRPAALVLAGMVFLSACGGADEPGAESEESDAAAPEAEEEAEESDEEAPQDEEEEAPEEDEEEEAGGSATESLDALYEAAQDEDEPVIWYESSTEEMTAEIITAFNEEYPDVEIEHRRSPGGTDIAALVVQESEAGARTADVTGASLELINQMDGRDLLMDIDTSELGIDNEDVVYADNVIALTHAFAVAVWNTELVSDDEAPRSWEDMLDPKWSGEMTAYERAGLLTVGLTEVWGQEKVEEWIAEFVEHEPFYYTSTFSLASDIAAGVYPVGLGIHHTTLSVIDQGAPVDFEILDPIPVVTVANAIIAETPVPNSSKLWVGWLASPEGAAAYESATGRGNMFIPGTEANKLLDDYETAEIPYSDVERMGELIAHYDQMFWERGEVVEG